MLRQSCLFLSVFSVFACGPVANLPPNSGEVPRAESTDLGIAKVRDAADTSCQVALFSAALEPPTWQTPPVDANGNQWWPFNAKVMLNEALPEQTVVGILYS